MRERLVRSSALVLLLVFVASVASSQSILTVAGGGPLGDGRAATAAVLSLPDDVAVDAEGNVYIADTTNQRVRRVDARTGRMSTVAGGGTSGVGDGGPATEAEVLNPRGVAVDGRGNLYVLNPTRVRRVALASGVITTVAGTGVPGEIVDGGPATASSLSSAGDLSLDSAGNIFLTSNHRVVRVDAQTGILRIVAGTGNRGYSGDGGAATAADLDTPFDVAVDRAGNLFIADFSNDRVRKVDAQTGIITTVAGGGTSEADGLPATSARVFHPAGLAIDAAGNLYISVCCSRVKRVDAASGIITTFAGAFSAFSGDGGAATAAGINFPRGIFLDAASNLWIADTRNQRIRKVDGTTRIISTIAGGGANGDGGPALSAHLSSPSGITLDSSRNLYIADQLANRVRKVSSATGIITTVAGTGEQGTTGEGGQATAAKISFPSGVAVDSAGNLFIAAARVRRVDARTGIITTVVGNSTEYGGDGGPATQAGVNAKAIAIDAEGNLYIADAANRRIRKVTAATGIITTVAGIGPSEPAPGGFSGDGGPAIAAALGRPSGVAVDRAGNIYIADEPNGRVRKVTAADGIITTVAGRGQQGGGPDEGPATQAFVYQPDAVAVDGAGNLFISDRVGKIRRVDARTGILTTLSGLGSPGFRGDAGPARSAALTQPDGIATDESGNVFVSDTNNNRVRVIPACVDAGVPSLVAPEADAAVESTAPTLSWNEVKGAFRYDLYLSTSNPPRTLVASELTATSFTVANLAGGTRYYWQVAAKGDPFCTPVSVNPSVVRSFTVGAGCTPPGPFDGISPPDQSTGVSRSVQLSWQASAGAANYDVHFGPANPPPLLAGRVTSTTFLVSELVSDTTYYWYVSAHAACDGTRTASTQVRSFKVAGGCAPAGPFALTSPPAGTTNVPLTATLQWSASANTSGYDLYFGTTSPPPIYLFDLAGNEITIAGLFPSRLYFWRVVSKVACDPARNVSTAVSTFTTIAAACTTPAGTSVTFVPPGNVGVGQTYTVAWAETGDLDSESYYEIERSLDPSFSTLVDTQQSFSNTASFLSTAAGTYYHRVRAIRACDPPRAGPNSPPRSVTVVAGTASVVFTVQPSAVITSLGTSLEDRKSRFTLENLSSSPVQVIVGKGEINSIPFFTITDPLGGDAVFVTLEPRTAKTFDIQFSGPPNDRAGTYQGIVFVAATGQGLAITPYAFINLKVGGGVTSRPIFAANGQPAEFVSFPGLAGDDASRPPITVDIRNSGSVPMELGAEIGPEVWLVPESGWNALPIEPGATRSVRLSTRRSRAPNGSALPRYTYFTVRSQNGETARLLVQDNDALPAGAGRSSLLEPGSRSFIVPGVQRTAEGLTTLRLTNIGSEPVQADLFFTPAGADGLDARSVRRTTLLVPPNDVVTLRDVLREVFSLSSAEGQIEVRAAVEKIGNLIVSSSAVTPSPSGGSVSFQMPTLFLGEGARSGSAHKVTGVTAEASMKATLLMVETSGREASRVRARLYDSQGLRGEGTFELPRYGQRMVDVTALGVSAIQNGRIELAVESGGGTVAGLVILLDTVRGGGAVLAGQPSEGPVSKAMFAREAHKLRWGQQTARSATAVVPIVINGRAEEVPGTTRRTSMGLTASGRAATAVLTYRPDEGTPPVAKSLNLSPNVTIHFDNVLEQLFGLAQGTSSQGAIFIEGDVSAQVYARLMTSSGGTNWNLSGSLPITPTVSNLLSGASSARPLYLDGLEQSIDASRGARWKVSIREVGGAGGTVRVRLYEAGNRAMPIAEKRFSIGGFGHLELNTVFAAMDLDSDDRRKDRTNVLCVVSAESGAALLSAVGVSVDSRTGSTSHMTFGPAGGVPASGVTRLTTATPVARSASTRRRAVRRP